MKKQLLCCIAVTGLWGAYLLFCKHSYAKPLGGFTAISLVVLTMVLMVNFFWSLRNQKACSNIKKSPSNFDWGMHYFRAFAILNIVAVHTIQSLGNFKLAHALFLNSTIYFLFISGYLCQYLDLKKQTYPMKYYEKKLKNVYLPYLIWTFIVIALVIAIPIPRVDVVGFGDGVSFSRIFEVVILGRATGPYWYIPFVMVLFAVSPIILRLKHEVLIVLTFVAFLLFIIFPNRPYRFDFHLENLIDLYTHFIFFYLIGFVYARFRDKIDPYLRRYALCFVAFGIILTLYIAAPSKVPIQMLPISTAVSLQKMMFTCVVLVLLAYIRSVKISILDQFAKYSFTIYFIHQVFMADYFNLATPFCAKSLQSGLAINSIVCLVLFISYAIILLGISMLLKMAFGQTSRYYIGS